METFFIVVGALWVVSLVTYIVSINVVRFRRLNRRIEARRAEIEEAVNRRFRV